jgi:cholesterol 7-dehydrogenase
MGGVNWKVAFTVALLAVSVHLLVDPFDFASITTQKPHDPRVFFNNYNYNNVSAGQRPVTQLKNLILRLEELTGIRSWSWLWEGRLCWALLSVALVALAPWVLPALYDYFFVPLYVSRSIEEVEKLIEGKAYPGKRERRLKGPIPPPFPNAWFKVCNSRDIKPGEARDFEVLGMFLVVFRGKDDHKVRILDAYCPHMGANLGVGSKVVGNEIACPFHGWQFNGEGQCTKIPYAEKPPSFAKTTAWPALEVNGSILIWHDAEGRPPQWYPPEIKEINKGGNYIYHGASSHHVRAHIQDIPENGPDTAHLNYLHVPFIIKTLGLDHFFTHTWSASWTAGEGVESHLAHIRVDQGVKFLGRYVPGTLIQVTITQVGPSMVHLNFNTPFGKVIAIETITPMQALLQKATHQAWAEPRCPRWFAKFVLGGLITQFERDVPIWSNKIFLPNPMLVKEDGPISKYRRWFAKNFYSENSERVAQERAVGTAGRLDW